MKIDISDLLSKKILKKELNLSIKEDKFFDGSECIKFLSPIDLNGTLSVVDDIISLNGCVNCSTELTCSRCLDKFSHHVSVEINEKFSNNVENKDDEEIILIDSDCIDITEIIENNIILSLPFKKLCKEDCKGICQQCGANRNYSTCNCEEDNIDPRLAGLKDLFLKD